MPARESAVSLSSPSGGSFMSPGRKNSLPKGARASFTAWRSIFSAPPRPSATVLRTNSSIILRIAGCRSSPSSTLRRSPYMTLRWTFITSSYSRTVFRVWKFRLSTVFCARSMASERTFMSSGVSSSRFLDTMPMTRSEPKRRMISSVRAR